MTVPTTHVGRRSFLRLQVRRYFLVVVPSCRTSDANISIEEVMKLVISARAVNPHDAVGSSIRRELHLEPLLRDTGEWKQPRG